MLTPPPTPSPHPFTQFPVLVRITRAGDSTRIVDQSLTDARGVAQFVVPPSSYWVFLPNEDSQPLRHYIGPGVNLPDGTTVFGWAPVAVPLNAVAQIDIVFDWQEP